MNINSEKCSFCNKKALKEMGEQDYLSYKETDNFVKCTYCEDTYRLIGEDLILQKKGYLHKEVDKITLLVNILYPLCYIPLIFLNHIFVSNIFTILYVGLAFPGYFCIIKTLMKKKLGTNNTKQIIGEHTLSLFEITISFIGASILIFAVLWLMCSSIGIGIGTDTSTREDIVNHKYDISTIGYENSVKYYAVESKKQEYNSAAQHDVNVDKIEINYLDESSNKNNLNKNKADVDLQYSKDNEHTVYLKQKNIYEYIKMPSFSQKFLFMKSHEKLKDTITLETKIVIPENTLLKK